MEQDHKELGRILELFSFNRNVPGTVYWWPKGTTLFDLIVNDLKKRLAEDGYQDLKTAPIIDVETLKKSGHFDNYREKLFFCGNEKEMKEEKVDWCLKPMSCPGSIKIFNEQMHSYKDLPLKFSEFGTVFRYEQPGEVNGLLRTRVITQDDAHIYCHEDQIETELIKLIDFIHETYKRYGFSEIRVELSTRPEKSIGTDQEWQKAEEGLKKALEEKKIDYTENKGDGAFYGPKIDFHVKDSLGRSWQMGTIQLDFATAERLEANYIDEKGKKQNPVIIHRAILGSVERFMAVLLESTGGALPTWLSPVQAIILPVSEKHLNYAKKVTTMLSSQTGRVPDLGSIRCEIDTRNESVGKKIRDAEIQKVPYIIVVGDKEEKESNITVRTRGSKDLRVQKIEEFSKELNG
ncbi:MAG: Threonine-tRNA ligase [Berkelbacteria bacterium GW2011_GWA1_36_9]|uniref:Threonine--tRNA ligase n=1 Tax=Berkelbacteria bacterium GW2011_GWA1_36_9 TaxID=1618331 RepID=A0A0G0FVM2_9BACT|nr:MAG: Threonine-tRNA ligase [Berkelbacteria bacterium GW2011_GWA1_36_9]